MERSKKSTARGAPGTTKLSRHRATVGLLLATTVAVAAGAESQVQDPSDRYWPQWRGPRATGVSPAGNPPTHWSEAQNVRWKVEIGGRGKGTPVVWNDRVFVLTAVPTGERGSVLRGLLGRGFLTRMMGGHGPTTVQRFEVVALSRQDGSVLWRRVAREGLPSTGTHADGTWASHSAVTDGTVVCAFFGSSGIYCYDMDGGLLWETDLGDMSPRSGFGEGASAVLHGEFLIVPWDHEDGSFIVAVDSRTGRERWRANRDEGTSWTTPIVVDHGGRRQVITSATNRVRSYALETGELVWSAPGVTQNAIPSPVAADGLLFVTSGFQGSALRAIDLAEARGDLSGSEAVVWEHNRDTPYVPSPLLYDGLLYVIKSNSGILSAYDAPTGQRHYGPVRLRGVSSVYASPVGAADRVYITGRDGTTLVLRRGAALEVLATNVLEDRFDASAAVVDDEIFLRGERHLYCIARDPS